MPENKGVNTNERLPLLPLRGIIAYPDMVLKIDVGRDKSIAAVERALEGDQRILVVTQRDAAIDDPHVEDVYGVGTVVVIKHAVRLPDDTVRLLVEGESRALLLSVLEQEDMQLGELERIAPLPGKNSLETQALMRALKALFCEYAVERGDLSSELRQAIEGEDEPEKLADLIAANALSLVKDKQALLEQRRVKARMESLCGFLSREIQLLALEKHIHTRVHEQLDRHQKEYYLNEQLSVIHEELGDDDEAEKADFQRRLDTCAMNGQARAQAEREMKRLRAMPSGTPEASVSRNYVECLLELPWGKLSKDKMDVRHARKILDQDHFGLEKVKERILEYLAVASFTGGLKGPILCLVGPPGVGKTSIARSIARALGREFTRMSLGGVRDEAEIRGHRRTYIGAIPGRIISSIRKCGVMNPVFLLDEIDKMASDFRGDPASALLEALDPEQNATFADHYLECPFDLSQALFLTTANSTEGIPRPLLDRMEMIEVNGYTQAEKAEIAKRHLWPKQLAAHGLTKVQVRLNGKALYEIIDGYTRESGVRTLERTLAAVCRKAAVRLAGGESAPVLITEKNLSQILGARKFLTQPPRKEPVCGVVNGLAWTSCGGETLCVEVASMPGKGGMELTGQLGDVMKESARAAHSYVRAHAQKLGIPAGYFEAHDLHVHVPEGATPKDGPSAGVAITCAMASVVTGRAARQDVAMTGEVTLLGSVLPIGGVKEKLLAAHRMGIHTILLPRDNARDLDDIPATVRQALDIHLVSQVDEALCFVLTKEEAV